LNKIKILLIEDNRILREGIKALVNAQPDLKIVAASEGKHVTVREVRTLKAQVVLLDLGLQSENGLEVVKTLAREMRNEGHRDGLDSPSGTSLNGGRAAGFILKDA
jgi:DNA-binding NarL/FixJ family response regulator